MTSGFEVTDRAHSQTLLNCLDQQRIQGAFCDVTIVVGESKFRAHKNVLAASSLYFKERLSSWGPCGLQPVLELREVRAEVFAKILGFMYSSHLVVERLEQACELAAAGTHLGIPFLEELATPTPSLLPGTEDVLPTQLWRPECPFPTFPIDLTSPGNRREGSVDGSSGPQVSPSHTEEEQEEGGGGEAGSMEESQKLYTLSTEAFQGLGFSVEEESEAGLGGDRRRPREEEEGAVVEEQGDGQNQQQQQKEREGEGPVTIETTSPTLGRPPDLDLHLRLQREDRALSCSHCHKTFVHVKRLQTHQALCSRRARGLPSAGHQIQHLPEEQESGRSLPDPRAEEEHFVKVVDGHLLYFCAVCQRSYMTLSSLKRHANVHSWRRRYPCRYCDKVFALAEYRTKHEVWHTGERRYQCIFCWDTFVTYYNLKTHQKAFHGVDPGLGISQKTPNGGYKPKLNAFKLYRLLPMRSQKRPYKTYSRLGQGASACPLPGAESHPTPAGPLGPSTPATPSSVITYGRTAKSSVIVHGKALPPAIPSSVIAYNGRCTGREEMGALDSTLDPVALPSPPPQIPGPLSQEAEPLALDTGLLPQTLGPALQDPGPLHRDAEPMAQDPSLLPLMPRPPSGDHGSPAATDQRQEPRPQKPKRPVALARPKTLTYVAKPACPSSGSLGSRPGPLCQITVRIGEEAIVKRRISESDLIRDKALTPCPGPGTSPGLGPAKSRRLEALPPGLTAKKLRWAEEDDPGCQPKPDDFLAGESADELSDQDTDDNLWRPYYSYKPKRRGAGLQRAKRAGWRRKLSLRPPGRFLHRATKSAEAGVPGLAPQQQGGPEAEGSAGDCLCTCQPEGKECRGCMACEGLVSPEERGLAPPSSCDRAAGPPAGASASPSPIKKAPTWRTKALGRQRRRQQIYDSCFFWDSAKDPSIISVSHVGSQVSRLQVNLDFFHSVAYQSEFDLRTLDPEGVIFYGDRSETTNWFILALRDGHPEIQLSNKICRTSVSSGQVLNDGKWRRIMVQNGKNVIRLLVDGKPILVINIIPSTGFEDSHFNLRLTLGKTLINESDFILPLKHRLDACIANWNWLQQNTSWLAQKVAMNPNLQCPVDIMPGTFFPGGGVVVFEAGGFQNDSESLEDWSLRFEAVIRPKKHTGVVLAILSKTYNVLMQFDIVLKNRQEVFRLKLGDAVLFELPAPSELCNGHKITLSLSAEMISLQVVNKLRTLQETRDSIATLRSAWIEKEAFVFLGGLPALDTLGYGWYYFQGCMQNLRMQGESLDMNQATFVHNGILTHSCPASK